MPYLIVERASVIVERKKLDKDELSIGRSSGSDVVLDDPQISASLAVLRREGDGYALIDQGSMTGITYQGERVSRLDLKNGMRFEAFPFSFVYEDDAGHAESARGESRLEATVAMDMSEPGQAAQLVSVNGQYGPYDLKAGANLIGRRPDLDIVIDSTMVSKDHAVLIALPGEFIIEDRGSVNGTYVNRRKVTKSPVRPGDLIQFGGLEFKVVQPQAEDQASAPAHQTADIPVESLLLGGALDQQAQALASKGEGKGKGKEKKGAAKAAKAAQAAAAAAPAKKSAGVRVVRLLLIGVLTMVLLVLIIAIVLSSAGGGGKQPAEAGDQTLRLKIQQAQGILASGENLDSGIKLMDEVLQAAAAEDVKQSAKEMKDKLLAKQREPVPMEKMTQLDLKKAANDLVAKGKILESVRYWERLVSLDPNWESCGRLYSTLMYQIGLVYDGAGNHDQAMAVWKREQAVLPEASAAENSPHQKIKDRLMTAGASPQ